MRYSSALVLSTVAVGSAAAANIRHASFHARRSAEKAVAWGDVAYDLSKVDWSKVNWSSVFNTPTPTPAPVQPTPKVEEVKSSEAPAPTSAPEVKPSSAVEEKPKETPAPKVKTLSDVTNDITKGVEEFVKSKGIVSVGKNSKEPNGAIWLGESQWAAEFSNSGSNDIKLFCWTADGFSGMSLNVKQPAISINLAPGASQIVSFAEGVPSSCAPAEDSTNLGFFGGIENTWWEVTFGSQGAFDVSRNVWMHGTNIDSKGSKCTSNMDTCVFTCNDPSVNSCEKGYELHNCNASNGGGGGFDPVMGGTGGGCAMGSDGELVHVKLG